VLFYLCTNWTLPAVKAMGMKDPPSNTPQDSIPSLNTAQMQAIIQCCKVSVLPLLSSERLADMEFL
jgi:hypothetical protein